MNTPSKELLTSIDIPLATQEGLKAYYFDYTKETALKDASLWEVDIIGYFEADFNKNLVNSRKTRWGTRKLAKVRQIKSIWTGDNTNNFNRLVRIVSVRRENLLFTQKDIDDKFKEILQLEQERLTNELKITRNYIKSHRKKISEHEKEEIMYLVERDRLAKIKGPVV
jgi:hypothetical protein